MRHTLILCLVLRFLAHFFFPISPKVSISHMCPKFLNTCERTSIARTSSLMLPVPVYTDFLKEITKINIMFSLMVKHKIHCIAFKVNNLYGYFDHPLEF